MRLNEFLTEGQSMTIKVFDITKLDIDGLIVAYANAGYVVHTQDRKSFTKLAYQKYSNSGKHIFLLLWKDDESDNRDAPYAISTYAVTLAEDGKVHAEPDGMPIYDGMTKEEGIKKLESLTK